MTPVFPPEDGRGSMSIDTDTVLKVARLSRVAVTEEELGPLVEELDAILGWVEQLSEVDVEDVEPMTSVTPMELKRRADQVTDGSRQDDVLLNAPDARDGFFAVPKVVE